MHIRPATPSDAPTIVEFQLALASETEAISLDNATVTRGVTAVFNDPAKGRYWIAESDNTIAGSLLTVPEWSDWRNGTVLWIHSVYVRPKYRRQGVFRALYAHLKQIVIDDDALMGLRLYVEKENQPAHATYHHLGMDNQHYQMYEWLK